jgi:hypothetical protein
MVYFKHKLLYKFTTNIKARENTHKLKKKKRQKEQKHNEKNNKNILVVGSCHTPATQVD